MAEKTRYSDEELEEFREIINEKLALAKRDYEQMMSALNAFMGPWMDFIFAKFLMGTNYDTYTVAIGLYSMLEKERIYTYFRQFAAGSVLVAVPIMVLFMCLQKYYVEGVTGGAVKG